MQSKVAPFAATPDPTYGRKRSSRTPTGVAGGDLPAQGEEADLRLVIEEDQVSGSYVYKTVNRRTGEIVQQFPREEVLRKGARAEYHAGEVIRTKA
jgi:flagellar protein FlaG